MSILWFIVGAGMGSVANALIDRLPRSESWMKGRSHCDKCGHSLGIFDLIPLLSFVWLGGKCRYCGKKILVRNFLVELIMALSFMVIGGHLLSMIVFITVVMAVMDWETRLVSEWLVVLWGGLVVVGSGIGMSSVWGLVVGVGVIGGIWAMSRGRAMGFGDVEMAAVIGWWLGWPKIAPALWIAFVAGAVVGSGLWVVGRKKMKSEIAFGPFLIFGAWVAYFWGEKIMKLVFP